MVKKIIFLLLILVAVVGFGFFLKSVSPEKRQPNPNIKGEKVMTRSYTHMTGKVDAKVTVVEFGDFQCPYCGQAYAPVKNIVDKYSSNPNFNFIFRNFPLPQHPNAQEAAETAEAAGAQGKYWEMEGLLYEHQNDWSGNINPTSNFVSYAQQLGLDVNKFKTEVSTNAYVDNIDQDQADGNAWGVNSTPSFFVNGQAVASYTDLDGKIAAELAK